MTEHIDKKTKRQEPLVLASLMISLMATSLIFLIVILIQGKGSALLSTGISGSAGPAVHRISAAEPGKNIISSISLDTTKTTQNTDNTSAVQAVPQLLEEELKKAEEKLTFQTVDSSYFDDALFVGDSRTVGLRDYAPFDNADYFCSEGIGTYTVMETEVEIEGVGVSGLENLLKTKHYGKIYLMLGLNELYMDVEKIIGRYGRLVNQLRQLAPDSLLFLQANLYVTEGYALNNPDFNNDTIRYLNDNTAKALADGKTIFYLDVNPLFDDGYGNLNPEYSGDGAHVYGKLYLEWADWMKTQGIVKGNKEPNLNEGNESSQ